MLTRRVFLASIPALAVLPSVSAPVSAVSPHFLAYGVVAGEVLPKLQPDGGVVIRAREESWFDAPDWSMPEWDV